jgi:hypothetical protein
MDDKISNEATNDLIVGVMERQLKRYHQLVLALIAVIGVLVCGFFLYESQFDKYSITQEGITDSGGDVNVSGVGRGNITYAEDQADSTN